jgi:Type II secretion system (T2SS), protein K
MRLRRPGIEERKGFILIAVLMVTTVLSLAAYQYSDLMAAEALAAQRIRRTAEAKAFADSGVHFAMAILADANAMSGTLNNNPYDNPGVFQNVAIKEGASSKSSGKFSIMAVDYSQDSTMGKLPLRFGVTDEGSKLNINALQAQDTSGRVLHDALMKLPGMTDEIAYSIVDWIDADEEPQAGGAESDYYSARQPPYQCKNAPLDTLEELLLVKGVTPGLLFGNDRNRNGRLDAGEDDGNGFNPGWAAYLTVYSRERNVDAEGNPRVNLNGNDLKQLMTDLTSATDSDTAVLICAYRLFGTATTSGAGGGVSAAAAAGSISDLTKAVNDEITKGTQPRQRVSSVFSLVNAQIQITIPSPNPMGKSRTVTVASPLKDQATQRTMLPKLLDKTTTSAQTDSPGRVNVNTAPREVLLALPGLTEANVDLMMSLRPTYTNGQGADANFDNIAWMLIDAQVSATVMQSLERYITARTQVYRIQSIGYFEEAGPIARVEAIIDTNQGKPRVMFYRDLGDLGRSIDPRSESR